MDPVLVWPHLALVASFLDSFAALETNTLELWGLGRLGRLTRVTDSVFAVWGVLPV